MAKNRSCRRTARERIIYEKAVKMRKMTDSQLMNYVEEQIKKAREEGFNKGRQQGQEVPKLNAVDFIEEIGQIKGIGTATMSKIRKLLEKNLEGDGDV